MQKIKLLQRTFLSLVLSILLLKTNAQTGLNFQGVARNSNNVILASQAITLKLSILQGSATGAADFVETRRVSTNAQGLFTVVIGDTGAISTLGNFATINWKNTPKFLKIEMDPLAGSNFITMGTTQFQYVAYAQFASSVDAENIAGIVPVARGGTGTNSLSSLKTALALDKTSVGLPNVDNTSDALKPISTATQTALDLKANTALTVPYTGATGPVNLGAYDLQVNGLVIGKGAGGNRYSTVVGLDALTSNTSGQANIAIGNRSLKSNTIGESNTAVGVDAMFTNTAGKFNTAIGSNTLVLNETGDENTATGFGALFANTTGRANAAYGVSALASNTTAKNNTAVGTNALSTNTTAEDNTAVGANALTFSTGENNTALGSRALNDNRTGAGNTAVGVNALINNVSGSLNTAIGANTNITGAFTNSTAIGNGATIQASNTITLGNNEITDVKTSGAITAAAFSGTWSGTTIPVEKGGTGTNSLSNFKTALALDKTSVGLPNVDNTSDALKPISTATQTALNLKANTIDVASELASKLNITDTSLLLQRVDTISLSNRIDLKANTDTATFSKDISVNGISIGKGAGSKVSNTRFGSSALSKITTGTNNTAIGMSALSNSTTGFSNTANGFRSLYSNTEGYSNAAYGSYSLLSNTTGNYNTAIGTDGLHSNTTGLYNTAVGTGSLYSNTTGSNNTAIGNLSLSLSNGGNNSAVGDASMQYNSSGFKNAAIGNLALGSNTTGSYNTAVGYNADVSTGGLTNATAIGSNAIVNASNTIQLGNTSVTNVNTTGIITASGFGTLSGTSAQFLKADGTVDANSYVNSADTKIKIGEAAGGDNQGLNAIGIGLYAGSTNQGDLSVAIGSQAGYINQGTNAVAIGITSGSLSQAYNAIAIGNKAGNDLQGVSAIAIGRNAGKSSQGNNAIAIGQYAGETNQAANSIILNASATGLNTTTNGFYVAPIRSATASDNLYYNATTKEITYAPLSAVDAGTLTGTSLASNVVNSSLTSVGTLANVTTTGKAIVGASTAATASAVMEVSSTTQGFLPPRMTQAQRDAIATPAIGLMIFCTNCGIGEPEFFNGTSWVNFIGKAAAYAIGESALGGKIAYILQSGDPGYDPNVLHGLVAASADQSSGIIWLNNNTWTTTGATATAIGSGLNNTNTIIANQGAIATNYAAGLANSINDGGYTDWYLPSKNELNKLYQNKEAIGGFSGERYWSSSEVDSTYVWVQYFNNGAQYSNGKNGSYKVRAVRSF